MYQCLTEALSWGGDDTLFIFVFTLFSQASGRKYEDRSFALSQKGNQYYFVFALLDLWLELSKSKNHVKKLWMYPGLCKIEKTGGSSQFLQKINKEKKGAYSFFVCTYYMPPRGLKGRHGTIEDIEDIPVTLLQRHCLFTYYTLYYN